MDQFNVTNEQIQERNSTTLDRRQNQRRRALKAALIVFQNGYCDIKCHVLDFSDTGALLKPADVLQCPNQFVLKPAEGSGPLVYIPSKQQRATPALGTGGSPNR